MANLIAIVGPSGSGKSTSIMPNIEAEIKGLSPEETVIINVSNKPLPIKGGNRIFPVGKIADGGRQVLTSDANVISAIIRQVDEKHPEIKNLVIDDAGYLQSFVFMDKVRDKGYDKFNEIAEAAYKPIKAAKEVKRADLNIIFIYHEDESADGSKEIKSSGKMVKQYITLEGMFTVVLFAKSVYDIIGKKINYSFVTNSDGRNTAKSPIGMFKSLEIPNDMGVILKTVNEYYN